MYEQLSLFALTIPKADAEAISCFDNTKWPVKEPTAWLKDFIPGCEYVVDVGGHDCCLRPTELKVEDIPEGHRFYHYLIDGKVYSGIFVGAEKE